MPLVSVTVFETTVVERLNPSSQSSFLILPTHVGGSVAATTPRGRETALFSDN
jgi:hypothetical protein